MGCSSCNKNKKIDQQPRMPRRGSSVNSKNKSVANGVISRNIRNPNGPSKKLPARPRRRLK